MKIYDPMPEGSVPLLLDWDEQIYIVPQHTGYVWDTRVRQWNERFTLMCFSEELHEWLPEQ